MGPSTMRAVRCIVALGLLVTASVSASVPALARDSHASAPSTCITCLGPLRAATPDYGPPLGVFRYVHLSLHQKLRPEVLFLTAPGGQFTDPESWPLVKALDQFGTLSGLTLLPQRACEYGKCDLPGFDFRHVRYRSRYLALDSKEIVGIHGELIQRLSKQELSIFNRYASSRPRGDYVAAAMQAESLNRLPLTAIAGYVQNGSDFAAYTDFVPSKVGTVNSGDPIFAAFDPVQQSLATGKPTGGLEPFLIRDVDIETNILVGLMCRADHLQPESVCGRAIIRKVLKHVR